MNEKTCVKCHETKPLDLFSKKVDGANNFAALDQPGRPIYKNTCKACDAAYAREFRRKNKNYRGSGKNNKYPKEHRLLISAIRLRLNSCKQNYKKRNGECESDLTDDYLYQLFHSQQGKCRYLGIDLKVEKKHLASLSLDKIDPQKGYTKGNVQWVCWAVNRAKGEMSEDEFLKMCRIITEKCND